MELAGLLPLIAIVLIFWLLLIRPQQRRQRELRQLQESLTVGDQVLLAAGIYGVVKTIGDDKVRLEVAEGVELTVARAAVGSVIRAEQNPEGS